MDNKCLDPKLLRLIYKTGYTINQVKGQRVFGPPPDWPESKPEPTNSELFIGGIPRRCYEDELIPIFAQIGRIYKFRLMMDFSGTNKGFGFVTYTSREDAIKAIKLLNDFPIRPNRKLGVIESLDNSKLFIGNLPNDKTREDIFNEFSNNTEGVVDVIVYHNTKDTTDSELGQIHNNTFAFVKYATHWDASMARRKIILPCNEKGKVKLFGVELTVDWAIPEPNPNDAVMSKVTILFVRFLSSEVTEDMVKELFSLKEVFDLEVKRVKIIKNFAFVHFRTRSDAELALNYISHLDLSLTSFTDGNHNIEVMWAKPSSAVNAIKKEQQLKDVMASCGDKRQFKDSFNEILNPMALPFIPKSSFGRAITSRNNRLNSTSNQVLNLDEKIQSFGCSNGLSVYLPNLLTAIR